jgi:hypothetical protein
VVLGVHQGGDELMDPVTSGFVFLTALINAWMKWWDALPDPRKQQIADDEGAILHSMWEFFQIHKPAAPALPPPAK